MAGYSGTALVKKLGIREGARVATFDAPSGFPATLGLLPMGAELVDLNAAVAPLDVIVFFATERLVVERRFAEVARFLQPAGGLWIAWPKKAAKVASDLSENPVREIGLAAGLVDNKVCAIDETWSGLRFVYRLSDRPQ